MRNRCVTILIRSLPALMLVLMLGACQTMPQDLTSSDRDKLDRLLTLIDQRLDVATMVAQTKWNSGAPIDDPTREKQILDHLTANLKEADTVFARCFFQAQFDAGKMIQHALHVQWRAQAHGRFTSPPDLNRDIRPALDRITPLLSNALRQAAPLLQRESAWQYIQRQKLVLIRSDAADIARAQARDEALRPLLHQRNSSSSDFDGACFAPGR